MDFPTSSNYCLMMFPLMSHPFHHRFLFHSQLHLVRGFRTIFLIRPTFGQNIYPRIMRPQWPPWPSYISIGKSQKKSSLFPFFPMKSGPMPIPRPRFHSKPPPLPPGARCGRAGPGGPGASHEERTQPPKTWGFHQKWWCAIWLFNSSPWKIDGP